MPRPLRRNEPNDTHHVYNRVANGQPMFHDDRDRRFFIRQLVRAVERHGVEVLSFCLMGNHVHLVVRCSDPCLDAFVRDLMSSYVRYFNLKYGIEGRLCRDRYQSKLVDSTNYLRNLGFYVHRNPTALGYGGRLMEYPWSSLAFLASPQECPWWLNPAPILDAVGGQQALLRDVEQLHLLVDSEATPDEVYHAWAVRELSILEAIVAASKACSDEEESREAIALVARQRTDLSYEAIAMALGYKSRSGVQKAATRAQRRVVADTEFASLIETLGRTLG